MTLGPDSGARDHAGPARTRKEQQNWLRGPRIDDRIIAHLKGLTGLQNLNLVDTKVTDAGVQAFQLALPYVRILR
jgi:hypothetical protein